MCSIPSTLTYFDREEVQSLAKNTELLETDMEQIRRDLLEEKKHKRKLEKILADCAKALKTALTVKPLQFSLSSFAFSDTYLMSTLIRTQNMSIFSRRVPLKMLRKHHTNKWRKEITCWKIFWCCSTQQRLLDLVL